MRPLFAAVLAASVFAVLACGQGGNLNAGTSDRAALVGEYRMSSAAYGSDYRVTVTGAVAADEVDVELETEIPCWSATLKVSSAGATATDEQRAAARHCTRRISGIDGGYDRVSTLKQAALVRDGAKISLVWDVETEGATQSIRALLIDAADAGN